MSSEEKKQLAEALKQALAKTDKWFEDESVSKAFIVGYLQGTIKETIEVLKSKK